MKMLYISFIFLLIMVSIWAMFYYLSIEKTTDYFETELKNVIIAAENDNYKEAQFNITKIKEKWEKTEKLWVYFIHQGDVDDIGSSIIKIEAYIKTKNKSMTLSEIEELKKYLRMVKGNESLSLENIF